MQAPRVRHPAPPVDLPSKRRNNRLPMPDATPRFCAESVTNPTQFAEALALRFAVFCDEQRVPRALEHDAEDARALHVVVRNDESVVVATGRALRMRADGTTASFDSEALVGDVARIGRMAVRHDWRRQGLGELVLRALETGAEKVGLAHAVLHAQCQARCFYARLGYVEQGALFVEAGIEHVTMTRRL